MVAIMIDSEENVLVLGLSSAGAVFDEEQIEAQRIITRKRVVLQVEIQSGGDHGVFVDGHVQTLCITVRGMWRSGNRRQIAQ